jgi:Fe-S-cluster containining protein
VKLNMKAVDPVRYNLKTKFRFRCHKGISCFTRCCSNIDIMLTPYDIIVLKNRLGISSTEFLTLYTYTTVDDKTSHPFVFLRMLDDEERRCPFVTPEGCFIYDARPVNCRYYPVGQGVIRSLQGERIVAEDFYFFLREDHCKGFQEEQEWSIEEWRKDQGVEIYDELNMQWRLIQLRKNPPGHMLEEKKRSLYYMACYDVDRFKRFLFEGGFFEYFDIPESRINRMRNDDVELMKFGFDLAKYILMIEETLKVKSSTG